MKDVLLQYGEHITNLGYRVYDYRTKKITVAPPEFKDPCMHPYSYNEHVIFSKNDGQHVESSYSDRMMQWGWDKNNDAMEEAFGNKGQHFGKSSKRTPEQIEKYLQVYFENDSIELTLLIEGCNPSNGYPYWLFGWSEQ